MSIHSRISVSEVCSGPIPFVEEVQFWKELGVNNIGMISPKLEPIGWDTALVAETGLRVSNVGTEERFVADAVEFAAAMGADSVWLEPGGIGSRTWEEAADDFCKRIAPSCGARQRTRHTVRRAADQRVASGPQFHLHAA